LTSGPDLGGAEELLGGPTVRHAPRSGPEVKMEAVPKMARRRGSDAGLGTSPKRKG